MCWLTGPSFVGTQLEGSVTVFCSLFCVKWGYVEMTTWGLTSDAYKGVGLNTGLQLLASMNSLAYSWAKSKNEWQITQHLQ